MAAPDKREMIRRFYEQIINRADYGQLNIIFGENGVWHDPLLPGGEVRGLEHLRDTLRMFRSAFPDLHITVEGQIVEGDKVVTRFMIRATHKGDLMGIPATGKPINVTGISIIIFRGGKVVEEWIEEDGLGLMRQLGILPDN